MGHADRERVAVEPFTPGTRVEVRSRFDRSWSRGFEIVEAIDHPDPAVLVEGTPHDSEVAYRLRRRSDGRVLPLLFADHDLRPQKRGGGMWWY